MAWNWKPTLLDPLRGPSSQGCPKLNVLGQTQQSLVIGLDSCLAVLLSSAESFCKGDEMDLYNETAKEAAAKGLVIRDGIRGCLA